jgi:hypothetical protein
MERTCSKHGREEEWIENVDVENIMESGHQKGLAVHERMK